MATVYVTELTGLALVSGIGTFQSGGAHMPAGTVMAMVPQYPAVTEQTVAIGGGSVPSNAFQPTTRLIRVNTDSVCSIAIGANPTASSTTGRMAANQTEYFGVIPGHKIAVITNT